MNEAQLLTLSAEARHDIAKLSRPVMPDELPAMHAAIEERARRVLALIDSLSAAGEAVSQGLWEAAAATEADCAEAFLMSRRVLMVNVLAAGQRIVLGTASEVERSLVRQFKADLLTDLEALAPPAGK